MKERKCEPVQKTRKNHTNPGPPLSELFLNDTNKALSSLSHIWSWLHVAKLNPIWEAISTLFFLSTLFHATFCLPSHHFGLILFIYKDKGMGRVNPTRLFVPFLQLTKQA